MGVMWREDNNNFQFSVLNFQIINKCPIFKHLEIETLKIYWKL